MNWKKILAFVVSGGVAGSLGHYASEVQAGHQIAFTVGNILWPALGSIGAALAGLFTRRPQDDQPSH